MANDISNSMLLEHMQGMKSELLEKIGGVEKRMTGLEEVVRQGFEDARLHRQALQEDLEATIRLQWKQGRTLARLARTSSR